MGLQALLAEEKILPDEVEVVVHATTVATNAVLEDKGARTGLVTTEGFRDVLEFRRVRVPQLYNLDYVKPKPLVPRALRLEVRERLGPQGQIRVPLDERSVLVAGERLARANVQAVAICLLHAYANSMHEKRIKQLLAEVLDKDVFVTCSHEIVPEIREYERTSTTVVNAFLGPVMRRYLSSLVERLTNIGIRAPLHIMTSGGGQIGLTAAIAKPAYLVESGPAAGVIAASRIAGQMSLTHAITFDMGGTTAKTAIVEDARPAKTSEFEIGAGINLSSKLVNGAGYAIKLPFIDVSEIGSGGGSLIWFDKGGLLKVGPQSAASEPGPVCYDKGGSRVTLTDAFLTLGFINPEALVGGAVRLKPDKARNAVAEQIAIPLDRSACEAAYGAVTVAVANMVRAVKSVSTYRGRDPRDYTLVAFGGNGPLVAAAIARELSMARVLVPPNPGVLSASGLLVADHEQEFVQSFPGPVSEIHAEDIARAYEQLVVHAFETLAPEGFPKGDIQIHRFADLRYVGQAYELTVPLTSDPVPDLAAISAAFHQEHLRTYAHMASEEPIEFVNIRVVARVPAKETGVPARPQMTKMNRAREAYFGPAFGSHATPILNRSDLHGRTLPGPLIVEEYDSTCVVPPDASATADMWNNLIIHLRS
jgi:N-methylhydantoinase A